MLNWESGVWGFPGKCLDKNVNGRCVNTDKGLLVGLTGIGNTCMMALPMVVGAWSMAVLL